MNSRIYECHVMHARFVPKPHRFVYRLFMLAVDLDELPSLHSGLRLFSVNRTNLYAFRESDFLPLLEPRHNTAPEPGCASAEVDFKQRAPTCVSQATGASGQVSVETGSLKSRVLTFLSLRGVDLGPGGRVELVTLPRVFGYLFNPVSFYYCYDTTGTCVASIAEVTNTFREMKPYFIGPENRSFGASGNTSPAFHLRIPKHFYVSPFSDIDVAFDFHLRAPGKNLSVQIDDYVGEQRTLTSTLTGPARPLTDTRLAWFTLKYPLITLKIIGLIHWHALCLYLKKIPWFPKAARAAEQRDLYRPHSSLTSLTIPPDA